jgi:hypothetical protein
MNTDVEVSKKVVNYSFGKRHIFDLRLKGWRYLQIGFTLLGPMDEHDPHFRKIEFEITTGRSI